MANENTTGNCTGKTLPQLWMLQNTQGNGKANANTLLFKYTLFYKKVVYKKVVLEWLKP